MALKDVAAEYFSNMNSIANRMCVDMNETRGAYEDLWYTLTNDEQMQILNETIIKPEICLKYAEREVNDKNKNEYALKLIVDDNYSYQDEHSAPFSFRTPSQRNLSIFNTRCSDSSNNKKAFNHSKSKDALKPIPHKLPRNKEVETPSLIELEMEDEPLLSFTPTSSTHFHIPKTGLDLLDNW